MKFKAFATAVVASVALVGAASAQQFFRIGTGGTAGTYYPVGGMIANAVSQPGKIVVTAQASNGSLANVTGINGGAMESGFSQADVATWAQKGTGIFEGKPNVSGLRLIANLYPESVHVVVREGQWHQERCRPQGQAGRARRARLGHAGQCARHPGRLRHQGTRHQARIHQAQPGRRQDEGRLARRLLLHRRRVCRRHRRTGQFGQRHRHPAHRRGAGRGAARRAAASSPTRDSADTYKGVGQVRPWPWARSGSPATRPMPTRCTRSPRRCSATPRRRQLAAGHAKGKFITKENAVKGAGIPFHPGAEKFYKEAGLIK
jgi:hypothetical protein